MTSNNAWEDGRISNPQSLNTINPKMRIHNPIINKWSHARSATRMVKRFNCIPHAFFKNVVCLLSCKVVQDAVSTRAERDEEGGVGLGSGNPSCELESSNEDGDVVAVFQVAE